MTPTYAPERRLSARNQAAEQTVLAHLYAMAATGLLMVAFWSAAPLWLAVTMTVVVAAAYFGISFWTFRTAMAAHDRIIATYNEVTATTPASDEAASVTHDLAPEPDTDGHP